MRKSWDLNNLPMLPEKFETKVVQNSGIQKQFNIVKSLFDKAELVINCGDAGQEGELIQRWVMNEANYKGEVKRLWISSLTTEAIKEGYLNPNFSNTACNHWVLLRYTNVQRYRLQYNHCLQNSHHASY